jgi:hypothetical protein
MVEAGFFVPLSNRRAAKHFASLVELASQAFLLLSSFLYRNLLIR